MRIQTSRIASVPQKLTPLSGGTLLRPPSTAKPLLSPGLPASATGIHPIAKLPPPGLGGRPLYRVTLPVGPSASSALSGDAVEELLRAISHKVAEQLGTAGKLTHAVVWLSVDAKHLHDDWDELKGDNFQKVIEVGRLAGGLVGIASAAPGLSALARAETPLYFLADLGESVHRGKLAFDPNDYADVDEDTEIALKVNALFQNE